jgi:ferrochelatase
MYDTSRKAENGWNTYRLSMKIEDIVNLTEGTLTNSPKVQAIEAATVYYSKVEHGDLFFSSNQEEIDQAIDNGAYAIVYADDSIVKKDDEIAWIKVSDLQLAAMKLIRYVVIRKEAKFYLLSDHEMTFLKMILVHKTNITFISKDWRKAFEQILNTESSLFVGTDKELLELIKPDVPKLNKEVDGYVVFDTLFRTTFKVGGFVYQEKELIPFHLEYLLRVIDFCDIHELPYSLERLKYTKHFTPVFIDGKLKSTQASKSDKVAIFTDNLSDITKAREYVMRSNMWVKSVVMTPPKTKVPGIDHPYWFATKEELQELLKNTHYNYAFIYNADKSMLNTIQEEYSLF